MLLQSSSHFIMHDRRYQQVICTSWCYKFVWPLAFCTAALLCILRLDWVFKRRVHNKCDSHNPYGIEGPVSPRTVTVWQVLDAWRWKHQIPLWYWELLAQRTVQYTIRLEYSKPMLWETENIATVIQFCPFQLQKYLFHFINGKKFYLTMAPLISQLTGK